MSGKKTLLRIYKFCLPDYFYYLKKELRECRTVLDLGCGRNSPIRYCSAHVSLSVGVELFDDYLRESKTKNIHNSYIKADVRRLEFKENSFDAVLALDLIEHLTKPEGLRLIEKMGYWARNKVIIFTPNTFLYQDEYDGNILQIHKSSWNAAEFKKMGYKVRGMEGIRVFRGERSDIKFEPKKLWIIFSDISQRLTYFMPELAFALFAVKTFK